MDIKYYHTNSSAFIVFLNKQSATEICKYLINREICKYLYIYKYPNP